MANELIARDRKATAQAYIAACNAKVSRPKDWKELFVAEVQSRPGS